MINIFMSNLRIFSNGQVSLVFPTTSDTSQADAGQMQPGFNSIVNPNNPFDAIQLPDAISGTVVWGMIIEGIQEYLTIYAKNGTNDQINGLSNDTPCGFPNIAQSSSQNFICVCAEDGVWACNFSIVIPP